MHPPGFAANFGRMRRFPAENHRGTSFRIMRGLLYRVFMLWMGIDEACVHADIDEVERVI